jgi:hypothetical protein
MMPRGPPGSTLMTRDDEACALERKGEAEDMRARPPVYGAVRRASSKRSYGCSGKRTKVRCLVLRAFA